MTSLVNTCAGTDFTKLKIFFELERSKNNSKVLRGRHKRQRVYGYGSKGESAASIEGRAKAHAMAREAPTAAMLEHRRKQREAPTAAMLEHRRKPREAPTAAMLAQRKELARLQREAPTEAILEHQRKLREAPTEAMLEQRRKQREAPTEAMLAQRKSERIKKP